MNLAQDGIGASLAILKDLRITLKIGLVEIKMLMNIYNIHNLMPYILQNVLNGYLLKNLKMLLILLRSEEHTSELQSLRHLVCRLLLEKKKTQYIYFIIYVFILS